MVSDLAENPAELQGNPKYRREIRSLVNGIKEVHFMLCNLLQSAVDVAVFSAQIIDESIHGFGCLLLGDKAPKIGQILDYAGLGKYEVRWIRVEEDDQTRFGLMKI